MSCNFDAVAGHDRSAEVSIPIGFSNELQRRRGCPGAGPRRGFNPYRVFQ